jgi:hypothetical protein
VLKQHSAFTFCQSLNRFLILATSCVARMYDITTIAFLSVICLSSVCLSSVCHLSVVCHRLFPTLGIFIFFLETWSTLFLILATSTDVVRIYGITTFAFSYVCCLSVVSTMKLKKTLTLGNFHILF